MVPYFLRNDHVLLHNSVLCLTVSACAEYMQLEVAVANIAEAFIVNVLSNGCFWLTKRLLSVLVDYNIHILILQNATCCRCGCVSFFAECTLAPNERFLLRLIT